MRTRIEKIGDEYLLRIPPELAIGEDGQEVEIKRQGSALVLQPLPKETLVGIGEIFAMFSPDFMQNGRLRD